MYKKEIERMFKSLEGVNIYCCQGDQLVIGNVNKGVCNISLNEEWSSDFMVDDKITFSNDSSKRFIKTTNDVTSTYIEDEIGDRAKYYILKRIEQLNVILNN